MLGMRASVAQSCPATPTRLVMPLASGGTVDASASRIAAGQAPIKRLSNLRNQKNDWTARRPFPRLLAGGRPPDTTACAMQP
jgi:hypothetical protein